MSRQVFAHEVNSFPIKAPFSFQAVVRGELVFIKMYRENQEVGSQSCLADSSGMYFEMGRVYPPYRRLGYGTWIRAVIAWCAKRAGYKRLFQISTFMNNTPATQRPTSAYIMNKLGFGYQTNNTIMSNSPRNEHRVLNLNQNIKKVNEIIKNIKN